MAHPKGVLIDRAQKLGLSRPEFHTAKTGPEHEPSFLSDVSIEGEVLGTGQGGSKRLAERNAAEEALVALDRRGDDDAGHDDSDDNDSDDHESYDHEPYEAAGHDSDDFGGPWPMFEDLLAGAVQVAERRINSELRGDAARVAIRDFSLTLYKELLSNLGEVVEVDDDEGDDD